MVEIVDNPERPKRRIRWYHAVAGIGSLALAYAGYKIYKDPELREKFKRFFAEYGPQLFAGFLLASVTGVFSGAVSEVIKEVVGG